MQLYAEISTQKDNIFTSVARKNTVKNCHKTIQKVKKIVLKVEISTYNCALQKTETHGRVTESNANDILAVELIDNCPIHGQETSHQEDESAVWINVDILLNFESWNILRKAQLNKNICVESEIVEIVIIDSEV